MDGVVLAVLDGIGIREERDGNAFLQADTPHLDRLFDEYPYTELAAYGPAVGLPEGYIGNSEVGHLHLGAGRVIPQELVR
ncbi:MAG: 2,3-bisphosphoglycerate-independent phosphoglycerate mutase, partial [Candidatus Nanohaloarchaea archaeon]|nr:2,3-bisphosphoglycerate-independent phosphoglycerate mutase [Candidatus Nanohaloarchaea archaeon]